MAKTDIWEDIFNNPTLRRIIEEADFVDSDDDPSMEGDPNQEPPEQVPGEQQAPSGGDSGLDIEQLAADFQAGDITQDDLIKMYQAGNISKEEIQQIIDAGEGAEEPQSEEELLQQQISQTNDMFVKFALYDKITDLTEKLNYFKENFDDLQSDIYDRVIQLSEFLNILSSLIFSIETPVSYQMYGSILLQLTELFTEYNQEQDLKKQQEHIKDQQIEKVEDQSHELNLKNNEYSDEEFDAEKDIGQGQEKDE